MNAPLPLRKTGLMLAVLLALAGAGPGLAQVVAHAGDAAPILLPQAAADDSAPAPETVPETAPAPETGAKATPEAGPPAPDAEGAFATPPAAFLTSGAALPVPHELSSAPAAIAALGRVTALTPPPPRPAAIAARAAAGGGEMRCTSDGQSCIRAARYTEDVCAAIETSASRAGIDPHFFTRLLWQESRFEPAARSPVGAQGIAQFMPGTAAMVGLDDPWNPAKAIDASARYLRQLRDGFGNLGLAAIAYNGGEARAASFLSGAGGLPWETRAYVQIITGHDALTWRDAPPAGLDLRLAGDTPFRDACIRLAAGRGIKSFTPPPAPVAAWGVIVASHPHQSMANSYARRLERQLRPLLGGQAITVHRKRLTAGGRPVYTAQVGYETRQGADAFCTRLRRAGGRCIVLRN